MNKTQKIIRIVLSILFVASVAALGSLFTDTHSIWYMQLQKPAFQPPTVVFPIVWTALYILFAISLSLAAVDPKTTNKALLLYLLNGVLNPLWSYTFFYKQNPAGAFFVLILIVITAALLISNVYKTSPVAAWLLLPYTLWLFFALYLNYEIAFYYRPVETFISGGMV